VSRLVWTGLGGQGVLFLARVLAEAARRTGAGVVVGETHGMSQRGGSVTAHVQIGSYAASVIRVGAADTALCLHPAEAAAAVAYLRRGGALVVRAPDATALDPAVVAYVARRGAALHCTGTIADDAATRNAALLGFAASRAPGLPPPAALVAALQALSRPVAQAANLAAFAAGRRAAGPEVLAHA
jgi:indolepyruvate ferredoxin oxidoreductase beta subunit